MIRVNIHEAKTHLSRYLQHVAEGGTVILCRYGTPVAEIRPLAAEAEPTVRKLGVDQGCFTLDAGFFDPLPKDLENAFAQEA
ncbi:MAG: type II toxin-antitoxin system Phd/YefM family antitoxin [Bryobacterales bacterium]|jgi:antitoxin (DNA-binding transcriptional repressor) of toxin-antitoxin stability system|nr:type II toxin-antitoxin system Phd/YefM family antitoxin [Bryobacterales bacterium]